MKYTSITINKDYATQTARVCHDEMLTLSGDKDAAWQVRHATVDFFECESKIANHPLAMMLESFNEWASNANPRCVTGGFKKGVLECKLTIASISNRH